MYIKISAVWLFLLILTASEGQNVEQCKSLGWAEFDETCFEELGIADPGEELSGELKYAYKGLCMSKSCFDQLSSSDGTEVPEICETLVENTKVGCAPPECDDLVKGLNLPKLPSIPMVGNLDDDSAKAAYNAAASTACAAAACINGTNIPNNTDCTTPEPEPSGVNNSCTKLGWSDFNETCLKELGVDKPVAELTDEAKAAYLGLCMSKKCFDQLSTPDVTEVPKTCETLIENTKVGCAPPECYDLVKGLTLPNLPSIPMIGDVDDDSLLQAYNAAALTACGAAACLNRTAISNNTACPTPGQSPGDSSCDALSKFKLDKDCIDKLQLQNLPSDTPEQVKSSFAAICKAEKCIKDSSFITLPGLSPQSCKDLPSNLPDASENCPELESNQPLSNQETAAATICAAFKCLEKNNVPIPPPEKCDSDCKLSSIPGIAAILGSLLNSVCSLLKCLPEIINSS